MRISTLFNKLLNLQGLWVQRVRFEPGRIILEACPRRRRLACPHCDQSRSSQHQGPGRVRMWRHLGVWGLEVWIEAPVRRFRCRRCESTVTEAVPWARHGSSFTRPFEDAVGHLAQRSDKTTVSMLFGISWVTVGRIAERLVAELLDPDRLLKLRRISVDEMSFRKHHRYLTVVSDHDTGHVVWVGVGRCAETLKGFFQSLPQQARDAIEIVTMDMSAAYQKAVVESLPSAKIAFDHFHIAKLANEALNEVRREMVREARQHDPKAAKQIKGLLWPLAYRLEKLPEKHIPRLHDLDPRAPLGRAWLLKEQLLDVLRSSGAPWAETGLRRWIGWAARCRLQPFVRLGRTLRSHLNGVLAFMTHQVTNGRAEGINNKIRLLSHRAYGFHSAAPLIATIYLCCGGVRLPINSHLL